MEEIWKDIPGYEGYYQASTKGRIKSLLFQNNRINEKYPREKILKPKCTKKNNCLRVELWKDGKHKTYLTYRLVASTFLENYLETDMTVNHKDGNRLNNNIDNLEWVTRTENIKHGFRTGLYSSITKKIKLIDKDSNTLQICNSMKEASISVGKNKGYISEKIKKGIYENDKLKWELI